MKWGISWWYAWWCFLAFFFPFLKLYIYSADWHFCDSQIKLVAMPSFPTSKNYISHLHINCLHTHKLIHSAQSYCSYKSQPDLKSNGENFVEHRKGWTCWALGSKCHQDTPRTPKHPPLSGLEQRGAISQIPGHWKSLMVWRSSSTSNPFKSQEAISLALPTKCCLTNR